MDTFRILSTALLALTGTALAQGPLTPPPVSPVPEMKSLQQIWDKIGTDPRTAIPPSPAVPIAGPHYTISQPGSYYLTGNVQVVSGNGINITASNVTLDLNGFALISTVAAPSSGNAIDLAAGISSIEIKNGSITGGTVRLPSAPNPWSATYTSTGWDTGIRADASQPANGLKISHISVHRCFYGMVLFGAGSCLEHIISNSNTQSGVIAGGSITNSVASLNGANGISAATITNCTVGGNGINGMDASYGSVTNSTASFNGNAGILAYRGSVTNCNSTSNGAAGIAAYEGSVTHCTATKNYDKGIWAPFGVVSGCQAAENREWGIYANSASISYCSATSNNTTQGAGGGIFCEDAVVSFCFSKLNNTSQYETGTGATVNTNR